VGWNVILVGDERCVMDDFVVSCVLCVLVL